VKINHLKAHQSIYKVADISASLPEGASNKIQFLYYIIHAILLIYLYHFSDLFRPLSFSGRDIAPTFCDFPWLLKMLQPLIIPCLAIARPLRLAAHIRSDEEEADSKGGRRGRRSCLHLIPSVGL
jgi:hypothetical protein